MKAASRSAFTLFEVLLVVVLVGVLAAFLWPDFQALSKRGQIDESVTRCKALIGMCRASAMNESRRYRLTFMPAGSIQLTRQRDPLTAPEEYVLVGDGWAKAPWLLDTVWVDGVLPLPEGPPPLNVQDDKLEFFVLDASPQPLETPYELDFEPDGTSGSVRWIVRDENGRGRQMTLDGRLGRVAVEELDPLSQDAVKRPAPDAGNTNGKALETETLSP